MAMADKRPLDSIDFPDSELVIGLVAAVGADLDEFETLLGEEFAKLSYEVSQIRISDFLQDLAERLGLQVESPGGDEGARIESAMNAGDELRRVFQRGDVLALQAASMIASAREPDGEQRPSPFVRTAHVIRSLKRPEEVDALRRIYGCGFYLIGVHASAEERRKFLVKRKNLDDSRAAELMQRDESGGDAAGQRTRKTFELADVFIDIGGSDKDGTREQIERFLRLVFGHPFETPTPDEYGMFLAYSSSLRSASLGRQVGAAILSPSKEVLAVGCNDVPSFAGGLYWPGSGDARDHTLSRDPNDERKEEIAADLVSRCFPDLSESEVSSRIAKVLDQSLLDEITEFGRAVHAEMEALLSCARQSLSPKGATLYTTTFPCHNCAKHILAAGVARVVYIEPYEKSWAEKLHGDALLVPEKALSSVPENGRMLVQHFVGLGPRRYFDLFSMRLSDGLPLVRKDADTGAPVQWAAKHAVARVRMLPRSYLEKEELASREFRAAINVAVKAVDPDRG